MKVEILINKIQDIKDFSEMICRSTYPNTIYAQQNKCIVDARSLMGIMSLDLTKPINIVFDSKTETPAADLITTLIEKFGVKNI